jgi:enoyl-CoA hydratase/carnithine racemase
MLGMATRLPFAVAMRMAVMGVNERVDAKRAYDLGLVTEVVPHARLIPRATEIMEQIFEQSPLAVRAIIEVLHRGMGLEYHYKDAEDMGVLIRNPIQTTEDRREGTRAFAEKRKPIWKAK